MNEKISVIVPIYNVEKYLKRCVDSILNQEYKNYEVILVDDCSTDNSPTIAHDYATHHPQKCTFIQREKNGKLSAARNTGLKAATGEWVTFVDSDDWVDKGYLNEMYKVAKLDNSDIVACSYYHAWENGALEEIDPFGVLSTNSSRKEKVALMRNHACMRLFKTDFIKQHELSFPEHVVRGEDMGFTIPLMTRTKKISILKEPLYYYYQRQNSISNSNKNIDISFYYLAFKELEDKCNPGFNDEIEYRAINEFMYGLIAIMVKAGKPSGDIIDQIKKFVSKYPKWKKNKYLNYTSKSKRLFIMLASYRLIFIIRVLIAIFSYKQMLNNHRTSN